MELELWLDVVCPWCYLGKRRLDAALERFDARDQITLVHRSFELDPDAPRRREGTLAEMLAAKYGGSVAEAEARQAQLTELGREDGIAFRFERAQPGNTFDAHRLIHLAASIGAQEAVVERLMRGYFGEGLAIGDPAELVAAVADAGLDAATAREALDGDDFAAAVRADEERGAALGIRGVPFLVLDGRYGLSGAQPVDAYLQAVEQAWGERAAVA
ncbi:DsbA family oxidoreductase [Conexibacter woesei]|uniref:DSBA oxidoreductase n=1 Tax=Conexibacter woesei (strain DSM 14684 / CCUG 47730 / CIP 108061 / JCM 11494 / NBRC 100937 / ID131577) TaxID=469383 RepID=D3EZ94_CONWI|nr:DsbA family oxidoreductase [Conexibacter woesei]ADB51859.1 DSBA oxidoreductase [Conexibacter woesei DSM 14684]